MNDYSFLADLLNKYSQLTPWVQVAVCAGVCLTTLGIAYFIKETVAALMRPFQCCIRKISSAKE